ncbi:MAG: cell division protein FtsA [Candidatus Gorgyraea atricola]|nr:cell division protein FtsA [Candidatus Gorgyraea atricola]
MYKDPVCGLDIGASSIRALILEPRPSDGKEKILGSAETPTKGFSKGVVSNLGLLSDIIEETISKAEATAHCRIRKVITNISGVHIRTFKSRGSVHISDRPSEITEKDLARCIESARLIAMSLDREVIHLIPERFYIDDKMEITEPVGLFGSKLDVDLNIVTSLVSILQNITKAINMGGYEVEDIITSGAATSLAIFGDKELQEGAVIIDVGKDHTEASLFSDKKLRDCFYFPFGSNDLTMVLQDRFRMMFEDAEKLRIKCGIITKSGPGYEDAQSDQNRSGGNWVDSDSLSAGARLSRREVSNLLFPKVEEIMQEVYKKIEPFARQRKKVPYIRVVGGPSKMDGFIEAVEEVFNMPMEMARIYNTSEMQDTTFACALGLARFGASKRLEKKSSAISNNSNFAGKIISKIQSLLSEYF